MVWALALTRWSGPACFCNSPIARQSAMRAFARAVARAAPWLLLRSVMADNESKPTAITVSRIMRESVTTKAKPLSRVGFPRFFAKHKAGLEGEGLVLTKL